MRDILKETSPSPETSLQIDKEETPLGMIIAGDHPEETQDWTLEKNLEIRDLITETSLEEDMTKREMRTLEGREGLMIGVVILAMGGDAEGAARRPWVMGGLQ